MSDCGSSPFAEAATPFPEEAFGGADSLRGGFALSMADRGLGAAVFVGAEVDGFLRAGDGDFAATTIFFRTTCGLRAVSDCSPQPHAKAKAIRIQAILPEMVLSRFIISVSLLGF
jgi:hypothetical protein